MPTIYTDFDDDVRERVQRVLNDEYPELVAVEISIGGLFAHNAEEPPLKIGGEPKAATIRATTTKERSRGLEDVELLIDASQWTDLSDDQREALIDHELHHLQLKREDDGSVRTDDRGRPKIGMKPHDWYLSGFREIAERHGQNAIEVIAARKFLTDYGLSVDAATVIIPAVRRRNADAFSAPHPGPTTAAAIPGIQLVRIAGSDRMGSPEQNTQVLRRIQELRSAGNYTQLHAARDVAVREILDGAPTEALRVAESSVVETHHETLPEVAARNIVRQNRRASRISAEFVPDGAVVAPNNVQENQAVRDAAATRGIADNVRVDGPIHIGMGYHVLSGRAGGVGVGRIIAVNPDGTARVQFDGPINITQGPDDPAPRILEGNSMSNANTEQSQPRRGRGRPAGTPNRSTLVRQRAEELFADETFSPHAGDATQRLQLANARAEQEIPQRAHVVRRQERAARQNA